MDEGDKNKGEQVEVPADVRLRQLAEWVARTGAIGTDGAWHAELVAIVAGRVK